MSKSISERAESAHFGRSKSALGTNAKSASPCGCRKRGKSKRNQDLRAERFALQNDIRRIVLAGSDWQCENDPDYVEYNQLPRVVRCYRTRVAPTTDIIHRKADGKASYKGLFTCGSVWNCPICAHKIAQVRRDEVAQLFPYAYGNGYRLDMVTFTIPHYAHQSCAELLKLFTQAQRNMRRGKRYQVFKKAHRLDGNVRALEVKHGFNGWHPHTHDLFMLDADADPEAVRSFLLDRWEAECKKLGLIPRGKLRDFRKHAVQINPNMSSTEYLAKQDDANNLRWGGDAEMTQHFTKKGKADSLHPFQIAAKGAAGCARSRELFLEYMDAFKGRASLFWTAGLKKKVIGDQADLTDDQIAEATPEDVELLASLDAHSWTTVLSKNARTELLKIAEKKGFNGVDQWLRFHGLNAISPGIAAEFIRFSNDDPLTFVLDKAVE